MAHLTPVIESLTTRNLNGPEMQVRKYDDGGGGGRGEEVYEKRYPSFPKFLFFVEICTSGVYSLIKISRVSTLKILKV